MKILFLPDLRDTIGGPGTFQSLLANFFRRQGCTIHYEPGQSQVDALLLVNASRHILSLLKLKIKGVKIVQRLGTPTDYMRFQSLPLRVRLKNAASRSYVAWIRSYLADTVVYQSRFVQEEWDNEHGAVSHKPQYVIHNGVDTEQFTPSGERYTSSHGLCIVSLEGHQGADQHDLALRMTQELVSRGVDVELIMVGKPWGNVQSRMKPYPFVRWIGHVERAHIPYYLRGADVFISTDIITGCPNSVIESLACGTPVVGYRCGVLKELIEDSAGILVDPEGNPWEGKMPGNIPALGDAVLTVTSHRDMYRQAARSLAERRYAVEYMVEKYKEVLYN
jgi:glycosyltransferase involved in cell wall biosynthesis